MRHAMRATASRIRSPVIPSARTFHSTLPKLDHYLNADRATFERVISESPRPVLVQFFDRESQNCKLAGPALQRISSPGAAFDLVELDVERNQDLAESHKLREVPSVFAYKNGERLMLVGLLLGSKLEKWLEKL